MRVGLDSGDLSGKKLKYGKRILRVKALLDSNDYREILGPKQITVVGINTFVC